MNSLDGTVGIFEDSGKVTATGKWTSEEKALYLQFVEENCGLVRIGAGKGMKIFKRMAEFIKTRTGVQCRSHYQKMMMKGKARNKRSQATSPKMTHSHGADTQLTLDQEVSLPDRKQSEQGDQLTISSDQKVEVVTKSTQFNVDDYMEFEKNTFGLPGKWDGQEDCWNDWELNYPFNF